MAGGSGGDDQQPEVKDRARRRARAPQADTCNNKGSYVLATGRRRFHPALLKGGSHGQAAPELEAGPQHCRQEPELACPFLQAEEAAGTAAILQAKEIAQRAVAWGS